jgi:hypothetical protein
VCLHCPGYRRLRSEATHPSYRCGYLISDTTFTCLVTLSFFVFPVLSPRTTYATVIVTFTADNRRTLLRGTRSLTAVASSLLAAYNGQADLELPLIIDVLSFVQHDHSRQCRSHCSAYHRRRGLVLFGQHSTTALPQYRLTSNGQHDHSRQVVITARGIQRTSGPGITADNRRTLFRATRSFTAVSLSLLGIPPPPRTCPFWTALNDRAARITTTRHGQPDTTGHR